MLLQPTCLWTGLSRSAQSRGGLTYASVKYVRSKSSIPAASKHAITDRVEDHKVVPQRKSSEPWVDVDSLASTLIKHREANRARQAIDGIPINLIRHERKGTRIFSRKEQQRGHESSGVDTKRLVLPKYSGLERDRNCGGQSQGLVWEWIKDGSLPTGLQSPWASQLDRSPETQYNVPATQRLSDEISTCAKYLSPTSLEKNAFRRAYDEVCSAISQACDLPEYKFELIGSRATGLDGPLSDIDVNLKTPRWTIYSDEQRRHTLKQIYKNLRYSLKDSQEARNISTRVFLPNSVVPIIECVHIPSALTFQVQFSQSGYESLELTKAFVAEYPTLPSLFKILKQVLLMRGLTIGRLGGLTSYPLLNMIVVSLKLGSVAKDQSALGAQFLKFLDLFTEIDLTSTAIRYFPPMSDGDDLGLELSGTSCDAKSSGIDPMIAQPQFYGIKHKEKSKAGLMSLQDPADPTNDLGKSARLIKHVQETFIQVRHELSQAMAVWDNEYQRGMDMKNHIEPLLTCCLGANYSSLEESRQTLRRYGDAPELVK